MDIGMSIGWVDGLDGDVNFYDTVSLMEIENQIRSSQMVQWFLEKQVLHMERKALNEPTALTKGQTVGRKGFAPKNYLLELSLYRWPKNCSATLFFQDVGKSHFSSL